MIHYQWFRAQEFEKADAPDRDHVAAAIWRNCVLHRGVQLELNDPPDFSHGANCTSKQYATGPKGQAERRGFGFQGVPDIEP